MAEMVQASHTLSVATPGKGFTEITSELADWLESIAGENGLLIEPGDLGTLTTTLKTVLEDIALRARAGEVKDHELEAERGGSGLRYSFDILSGGKTFEVGVDAETGAVLENAEEGPNPD